MEADGFHYDFVCLIGHFKRGYATLPVRPIAWHMLAMWYIRNILLLSREVGGWVGGWVGETIFVYTMYFKVYNTVLVELRVKMATHMANEISSLSKFR